MNNLILYINYSREIYCVTEWLENALAKKIRKGLRPEIGVLANCSTMKKIVSMAAKMARENGETVTVSERKEAALQHAEAVLEGAQYRAKE